ncbi:hypothetical protein P108_0024 [Staphylococcus phage P108]|uniref:Uncharacterized protein n=1 Tax=Staphylococcus phage P108 TaxID=1526408 RepID=A0A076YL66_9CAUD|nr:hypothetical protein P108_0024 [Staphylococcus phage P108]AIK69471.1 hypothetical protein P108_0024 [Staphylococcus phage P108]WJZ46487.1 hypothetical protein [Staphylococcus phage Baghdad]
MKIKQILPSNNPNKYHLLIESKLIPSYYSTRDDVYNDYYDLNLYGMFDDNENLLCSCSIEKYNELVFMKRFVMVGEHGNGYFKQMVSLIIKEEPHICLTINKDNIKVADILNELGFINAGEVIDRTGKYTYELYQGGRA